MREISVLIPTYNAQATIGDALASLRRQIFEDWECILCDDGSTDDTRQILDDWARRDRRFTVVKAPHEGIVPALNQGLLRCSGRFVARFDADDIMHRARLRAQFDVMSAHPELAGIGCGVRMFPRVHLTEGRRRYEKWLNSLVDESSVYRDRFVECPLAHPALLLKREVFSQFGYRNMHWPEDYDLVLRLLGAGYRLSTVPTRLLFWREGASRLSRTADEYCLEHFIRCKAHFLAKDWLGDTEHYVLWGYGSTGQRLARALGQLGKRPSCIVELHPGRIGQRILQVPVISARELSKTNLSTGRIILSVAGERPRADARRIAASQGLVEDKDFVCAA